MIRAVWVGQERFRVGHGLPGLIARTASGFRRLCRLLRIFALMPARLQVSQVIIARGLHRQVAVFDDACQKMRCSVRRTYTYIRAFPTVMNVCVCVALSVCLFVRF